MPLSIFPPGDGALAEALVESVLVAAEDLGIPAALPAELPALARRIAVPVRRLRPLVDVLVATGALARDGSNLRDGGRRSAHAVAAWGQIAAVLRADRPLPDVPEALARYHAHLVAAARGPAAELARQLAAGLDGGSFVDAGCGAGGWTRALLAAAPGAEAVLVDAPAVLELAHAELGPLARRCRFIPGDFTEVDVGSGHRLVLLANLLHLHGEATCQRLVGRAGAAIATGGLVAVVDVEIAPDRSGPLCALLFALDMALHTEAGDVHLPATIGAWLAAAGLVTNDAASLGAEAGLLLHTGRRSA